MRPTTAINKFIDYYAMALMRDGIRKPVSWALYQAWRYADAHEKDRSIEETTEKTEGEDDCEQVQN